MMVIVMRRFSLQSPFFVILGSHRTRSAGWNGGDISFAHLYIRLIAERCKHHRRSVSVSFLGIVVGFAILLRCILSEIDSGMMRLGM